MIKLRMKSSNIVEPLQVLLPGLDASLHFAKFLANYLKPPLTLGFSGEIGMGKTTLIRSLFTQMGVSGRIKSPTFSIVETYQLSDFDLHHFDLYRIVDESELDYIGFRDYFSPQAICCIEWPQQLGSYYLDLDLQFTIVRRGDGREMTIQAKSVTGQEVLEAISTAYADERSSF